MDVQERRLGALFGAVVGDALGVTFEFKPAEAIPSAPLKMVGGGPFGFAPGQVSDDTDLLLAVLAAYPERNRFNSRSAVQNMVDWLQRRPPDVGIQTRSALLDWQRGHPPEPEEDAQGNGGLMRAAAHALACDTPQLAAANADEDTQLTHPSSAAGRCSAQFAALLSCLLLDAPLEPRGTEWGDISPYSTPVQSSSGHCVHSFRLALWALANATSFDEGIDAVIKSGGDTDTNGAIAGALLGARYGFSGIASDWVMGLDAGVRSQLQQHAARLNF